ncbi:MAG: CsbD family protein [Acidimicrobiales bacterium]
MSKKNKVKNATQVAKGHIEEVGGKVSGNNRLEEDGKVDQMKGNLKQASESVKDAAKK